MFNNYISLKGQNKISGGRSDPRLTCGYSCFSKCNLLAVEVYFCSYSLRAYIYIVDWGGFGHGVNSDGIRNVGAI